MYNNSLRKCFSIFASLVSLLMVAILESFSCYQVVLNGLMILVLSAKANESNEGSIYACFELLVPLIHVDHLFIIGGGEATQQ